jgi:GNAT superfamily N-acetyltransferase
MKASNILSFLPIDFTRHVREVTLFREDSFVCSFGNTGRLWREGDSAEQFVMRLMAKAIEDPMSSVHIWLEREIVGQMEFSSYKADPSIGYVNLFYLIPEMRGKGFSDDLDRHATLYLKSKGYKRARPDAPDVHLMEKTL